MNIIGGNSGVASLERTRYGLSLIEEILDEESSSFEYFLKLTDPWSPLLTIMDTKSDNYCASKAAKLISLFLFRSKQMPQNVLDDVLIWCNEQLRQPSTAEMALEGLQNLLRHDDVRLRFFEDDGLNRLGVLLKNLQSETQIIYKALLCLWLMSYNDHVASQFHHETNVIPNIIVVLKAVPKEKIIRIGTAVLANIASKGDNNMNKQVMIEGKIVRFLETANQRKWADEDLINDLEYLTEAISEVIREMSSWDAYKTEISSGTLERSPVHYSERFWKENVMMFEKDKFEVLGMLIHILKDSQNSQNLEIACHDIGQFIRYHPMGRQIISQMNGKYIIMGLMEHPDAAVQKEALLCTQKLLVVSWEHLGAK
mmetsp:Transcript_13838/g.17417  ORF Transcript_13838/g.17417 Transcript_13838/m.17417 type:complete len:370 (+) Transcript_13838:71-1180(+)